MSGGDRNRGRGAWGGASPEQLSLCEAMQVHALCIVQRASTT